MELLAFLTAIWRWKTIATNQFVRNLAITVGTITLLEFTGYFLWKHRMNNLIYYNTIAIPIIFMAYYITFYKELIKDTKKWVLQCILLLVVVSYIVGYISINPYKELVVLGYSMTSAALVLLAVLKLKQIITSPSIVDFLKMPLVYVLLLFLLYYTLTIPYYTFFYYISVKPALKSIFSFFYFTTAILNIILYASYTLMFLWTKAES